MQKYFWLDSVWLVPLLPLIGFLLNFILGRTLKFSERAVYLIGCGSVLASLVVTIGAFLQYALSYAPANADAPFVAHYFTWLPGGLAHYTLGPQNGGMSNFNIEWGYQIDQLTLIMMLIVTFVGFWIHVFSIGYMHGDSGYYRFFAYLNLFMFSMLILVMGSNFLIMFIGWEGVGLCSYLLIGYYFNRREAGDASKKAFIVNRIGDFGFALAVMGIFATFGTLEFKEVAQLSSQFGVEHLWHFGLMSWIALGLFVGATGKSAQIPLYIWLPDAMAGPTPVSALIHAATMVTAGVFMVTRTNFIFQRSVTMMLVVAIIGCLTAFVAATIAITQTDIKKVLAYSTVSQLGYMFMGAGVGAFVAAIFHVFTHAFFKAQLFLGSGSVIHAMHHEQEMPRMGGLAKYLPTTYKTMLCGWLAICGIFPLAGFWSKDGILGSAFATEVFGGGKIFWFVGLATAAMSAFYMTRLMALTFWGEERFRKIHAGGEADEAHAAEVNHGVAPHDALRRSAGDRPHHAPGEHIGPVDITDRQAAAGIPHKHFTEPHESPRSMILPLVVLAFFSVVAGFVGLPGAKTNLIGRWLKPVIVDVHQPTHGPAAEVSVFNASEAGGAAEKPEAGGPGLAEIGLMALSVVIAVGGILLGLSFYVKRPSLPRIWAQRLGPLYKLSANKWYWDYLLDVKGVEAGKAVDNALWRVDQAVVDGGVNGAGWLARLWSFLSGLFDKYVVDLLVNATGWFTRAGSVILRSFQTGFWQNYALLFTVGLFIILLIYERSAISTVFRGFTGK
jgi:NADH-quinone oxidoreductase subunit L